MPNNSTEPITILALDIGNVRVGVARANSLARFPETVSIINNDEKFLENIAALIYEYGAKLLVVGLPLHASGDMTEQAKKIMQTAKDIADKTAITVVYVDESLTSKQADDILSDKKDAVYHNDDIAAYLILERYFTDGALKHV